MINKIRFIEPGNFSRYKKSLKNIYTYNKYIKNPSTGLITLTTIAKRLVDDTLMYSESISKIDFKDVYSSDIVFISINTYNAKRGYELCSNIRNNSKAMVVLVGMHASLNYLEAVEYADYVLMGDGDELIVDFINCMKEGKKIDFKGVVYKIGEVVINTGKREQPVDIDTIPDRNLVYNYSKLAKRYNTLWPQVHGSRGCPHNCDYCAVIQHFGRKIRHRTPQSIVQDIKV